MRAPRRADDLARRIAAGTGIEDVLRLQRRVDALAESVAENAALEGPLTARVTELELALIEPLEHRLRLLDEL